MLYPQARIIGLLVILMCCGFSCMASDFSGGIFTAFYLAMLVPPLVAHIVVSTRAIANFPKNNLGFIVGCIIVCGIFTFAITKTGTFWPAYSFGLMDSEINFSWYNGFNLIIFISLPILYRYIYRLFSTNYVTRYRCGMYIAIISLALIPVEYATSSLIPFPDSVQQLYTLLKTKPLEAYLSLGSLFIVQAMLMPLFAMIIFAEFSPGRKFAICGIALALCTLSLAYMISKIGFYYYYSIAVVQDKLDLVLDIQQVFLVLFLGSMFDINSFVEGSMIAILSPLVYSGSNKKWVTYIWMLIGILKLFPLSGSVVTLIAFLIGLFGNIVILVWLLVYFRNKLKSVSL